MAPSRGQDPESGRVDVPSPSRDVPSPERSDRDHPDSWTLQAILGIKETQGATTEAIKNLTTAVDRLGVQLGKIDDLRIDVAKIDTKVSITHTDLESVKKKLETVRTWVIGAAAIVAFIAFAAPIVVRFWGPPIANNGQSVSVQRELAAPQTIPKNVGH